MVVIYNYDGAESVASGHAQFILNSVISCLVTEELNNFPTLEMKVAANGKHADMLVEGNIVGAKMNRTSSLRDPFRINKVTRPLNGIITVYAKHIIADLEGFYDEPRQLSMASINSFIAKITSGDAMHPTTSPYTLTSEVTTYVGNMELKAATAAQNMLGADGVLKYAPSGEWLFNCLTATFKAQRGTDRGLEIKYGKNLTDYKQEELNNNIYSHVFATWKDEVFSNDYETAGTHKRVNLYKLDVSNKYQTAPTMAQLNADAQAYITAHPELNAPKVSIDLDFIELAKTEEYKGIASERVELGDTAKVIFPMYGISTTARINKIVYNALTDSVEKAHVGTITKTLTDTILDLKKATGV